MDGERYSERFNPSADTARIEEFHHYCIKSDVDVHMQTRCAYTVCIINLTPLFVCFHFIQFIFPGSSFFLYFHFG